MLHIRSTFYKILFVFAGMIGLQIFLLSQEFAEMLRMWHTDSYFYLSLDALITESGIHLVFLAGFLLITLTLTLNGFEFKEKISYTIRRLSLSEKHYFLLQGLYYSMIYLLLFFVEIGTIAAFSLYYMKTVPDGFCSNQTLFLTFYTNNFLHSLLPLEETVRVVRNILLVIAFGYTSAYQSYSQRRGKKQWMVLLLTFLTILNFKSEIGTFIGDLFLIWVSAAMLFIIGWNMIKGGTGYEN
jgi:hypothetical protein